MSATTRKWLRRLMRTIAALLALACVVLAWLLETESGARFALVRAKLALEGKLEAALARGVLAGPLELHDVRYRDPAAGIDVTIQSIKVDYAPSRLFSHTLHVAALEITGVNVGLTTVAPANPSAPAPSLRSLLSPPLAILLDRARVANIVVKQDGNTVFSGDSLDLAASWTGDGLAIRQLALRTPEGKIDLDGALTSYRDLRGAAKLRFDWQLSGQRLAGDADLHNVGSESTLTAHLDQPLAAALQANLKLAESALPWVIRLDVPAFDANTLVPNASVKTIALNLQGSGDRAHGKVSGNIDLNAHRVLFDPLQFTLDGNTFTLETLHLRAAEAAGALTAQARLRLDASPVSGEARLDWEGVELPADLVGQVLATHGSLHANGTAGQYAAESNLALGPPGRLAEIALQVQGTPRALVLQRLALKQKNGGLEAHGNIVLQPQLGWDLAAKADKFDPGALAKEWPGAIDVDLSTNGQISKAGPAGRLQVHRLGGTLRQRALGGNADLRFAPPFTIDGALTLASGNSSVSLRGSSGERTAVDVDLAIASLGDWLPQAGGSLRGNIALQGTWPNLDARTRLEASKFVFGDVHADSANIVIDARDLNAPSGQAHIDGKTLSAAGYLFDSFKLDAHGDRAAHTLAVDLQGPQLGLTLALDGAVPTNGNAWRGALSALTITPKDAPSWALQHPATMQFGGSGFELGELCLGAESSKLCAAATQTAAGSAQARFSIAHLPLQTIARIASPEAPLKLEGEVDGDGELSRAADGVLGGRARITSASGSVAYPDSAAQPLLAYKNFNVDASLAPKQGLISLHGELNDGGHLDGHITLGASAAGAAALGGEINAALRNVAFIDLLSSQTASTQGRLDTDLHLGGTTAAPTLTGRVALADFATEIPAAGIKLRDAHVNVLSGDGRSFTIDGSFASGSGKLILSGSAGTAAEAPLSLKITGEDFLAADIPGAQVRISPDLMLARAGGKFTASGTVRIPKADIDLSKLPGGGAAAASPDVVVTDAETPTAQTQTPFDADIMVKFGAGEKLDLDLRQGQEVHLVGFGLNGYLSGQLAVQERPGRATTGRGQIVVDGTYKAYGQDLTIEQGRLLFAGTPLENPGLDLRAKRSGFADPDVTVGLQVRGTAQVPVLTVFSTPAMEQSDALSYLVAGKPLSQLKSGEGDAVNSAARALGTAGGNLLAKSIGTRMGLDDVGVADSSAVGGAALTVGKYLSPRVYLSYGVGLFTPGEVVTLRYRLTRLFNVEVQNGTLSSRAGLNYRIEK